MLKLLKEIFKTGDATVKYPFAPLPTSPGFRGKPEFAPKRCIACAACTIACPANALTMTTDPVAGTRTWMLNYGRCIFCARCEEVCPTGAIVLSGDFELAVRSKADLMVTAEFTLTNCRRCETPFAPTKEVDYVIALLVRAGLPEAEAERRRELYETCPGCRRSADVPKVRVTAVHRLAEVTL
jgi:formate hydrogenlyase subunit 6/NADH:ubiquinone oxidoreductase subunit I